MRKIRGWIKNLADGHPPIPHTVDVHAFVRPSGNEIDNEDHQTGSLFMPHLAGSGSATEADAEGHFGWDMQLSPGLIDVQVNPTDPIPGEHRFRFPDESAQIGAAYHSDLERLGWTGGRDGLVWHAIAGPDATAWTWNPKETWAYGNWAVSFRPGMSVSLAPGIGFLGGVLFSVEGGPLNVPVAGQDPPLANGTPSDRWDILYLQTVTQPDADDYGKQSFHIEPGSPGSGIPSHMGQPTDPYGRRLAMFALKVAANSGTYSEAYDLRRWLWHPALESLNQSYSYVVQAGSPFPPYGNLTPMFLNTAANTTPFILPPAYSWQGWASYQAQYGHSAASSAVIFPITEALDLAGTVVTGTNYAPATGYTLERAFSTGAGFAPNTLSLGMPIRRIPSYHLDGGVYQTTRSWSTLRWAGKVSGTGVLGATTLWQEHLLMTLWPVL